LHWLTTGSFKAELEGPWLAIGYWDLKNPFLQFFLLAKWIFFHFSVKKSGSVNNANNGSKENPRDLNSNN
jgi:hypothetical protein